MKKAIFLDFDGTLTDGKFHIWKHLWRLSGFSIDNNSYYAKYKKAFIEGNISYSEWCKKSLEIFKNNRLTKRKILKPARNIKLLKNAKKFIKILYRKGFKIYILSGNFKEIISKVLGKNIVSKIKHIQANEFEFEKGKLNDIIVRECDYVAKPQFIKMVLNEFCIDKNKAIFIGNGQNDESVKSAGIKTICINAEETDYNDKNFWDEFIFTNNFIDCLKFIDV